MEIKNEGLLDTPDLFVLSGVLSWDVEEQVDAARHLIAEPGPFRPAGTKGRQPA